MSAKKEEKSGNVILSAAKDRKPRPAILRCAQDDMG